MIWVFVLSGFLINAIGLLLLHISSKNLAPEISHDSNPHLTNPLLQRYNSALFNVTSPLCTVAFVSALAAIYITAWAPPGKIVICFLCWMIDLLKNRNFPCYRQCGKIHNILDFDWFFPRSTGPTIEFILFCQRWCEELHEEDAPCRKQNNSHPVDIKMHYAIMYYTRWL